jgi:hypothetical protein
VKRPIVFIAALVGAIVTGALVQTTVDRHSERWADAFVQTKVFGQLEQWVAWAEGDRDVDFQTFVGRLKKAVAARDADTLAPMMAENFLYALGATEAEDRKGDGVFEYWDKNGLWTELDAILAKRFASKGEFWVAPPQFADASLHYTGYRVGIHRIGGIWKFVYFVNG